MKRSNPLFGSLFLIGILLFSSCEFTSTEDENSEVVVIDIDSSEILEPIEPEPIPETLASVDVAVYVEYPEGIEGCACYFGRTADELSEGKYVFMTNYEKKAYMELDGEMRVFELTSSTDLDGRRLMERWKSDKYDMVVKTTETGQIDETWQRIGTINIKPKDKDATMLDVVGECGC
ncbi:MAG: hypothetical protein P8P74_11680 [Crocinitomicaceae bacterium]|nr:hypothetical protein [Crocinitomicaceae bacterium]